MEANTSRWKEAPPCRSFDHGGHGEFGGQAAAVAVPHSPAKDAILSYRVAASVALGRRPQFAPPSPRVPRGRKPLPDKDPLT